MTALQEQDKCSCPVCESTISVKKLSEFGLTTKEFEILQKHKNNETLGACLHLVDILMEKIEPEKLSVQSEVQNMIMELQNAKLSSEVELKNILTKLSDATDDIQKRIAGTGIGKLGETITVKELKAAFPFDNFTDEKAKKAGTDVISTVIENGKEIGKIAISCKYDVTWNREFLEQLQKNMNTERTEFGILVTKSFPTEALDDKVHYLKNNNVMLVKPEFLSIAYSGFRRAMLEWKRGQNSIKQIEEKYKDTEHIINKVSEWINQESNPIVQQVESIEKLSKKTHDDLDKSFNYIKKSFTQLHNTEDEKLEKLVIISEAIAKLEEFLDSESKEVKND